MMKSENFLIELTTFFLLLSTLNNIEGMGIFRMISINSLIFIGTFFLMIYVLKYNIIKRLHIKFLSGYFVLISVYIIGFLIYPEIVSIKTILLSFGLINFFLLFSAINFKKCNFKVMKLGIVLYIFIFVLTKINILSYARFWRMFTLFPFLMIYFLIIFYKAEHRKGYLFMIAGLIYMIIDISSRSVVLIMIVSIVIYILWNQITKSKFHHKMTYLILFIGIFVFIATYINWYVNPNKVSLAIQEFSQKTFGKNLYSGRERLWLSIIKEIKDNLIFGYGTGVNGGSLIAAGMSVHNLYLQLLIQNGLLGLISFIILLYYIWMLFWNGRNSLITRLSASIFISSIVHNVFEVILLQNHMAMAFWQWFIFALGANIYNFGEENLIKKATKKER